MLPPGDADCAGEWFFFPLVAQRCDYRCSCADGVGRVSLECLSSERDAVVLEGGVAESPGSRSGRSFDTVLQSDTRGRGLPPNVWQSDQVL